MSGLCEFALGVIAKLVTSAIQKGVEYTALPFFQRRKIERRIEDATAEVVEPLLPFLSQEGIPDDKQRRLIQTCVDELWPLTENPELLFQGSLDGQKIFENLYADRDLPEVVIEDGLKDVYALLCPRIATLLCKIPAAVKDWESEAWSEDYRRLDEITGQMGTLFGKVDELARLPSKEADATLTMVRRALAQKIRLELDLTGLRADRPLAGRFDDFFVHPEITETVEDDDEKDKERVIGEPDESFDQFTHASHRAIVIGAPGAGKSTWAKWLQRETLTARWTGLGIGVELRRFSSEALPSLHNLIREAAGKHLAEELTANRISRWLNANQVAFILDGFDEVQPSERDQVYDWIVELRTVAGSCAFVLTSRPLTTDHLARLNTDWQSWTIEPFDEDRIIDYIQRWYTHTPLLLDGNREVDAAALAAGWRSDHTIGPLTGNPLLLSTLLMVHHLDGRLPSGRSQLYRRYVEGMLGVWDDRRKVVATTVDLPLQQKRQIMRGLALHLFLLGQDQLDEPAMLDLLQGLLQELNISSPVEDVLSALSERSGLIVGPGIYSFVHKSVAEYLVAEAVLQGDQRDASGRRIDRFCLFEHRDDDRWNAVTFLWAGLAPVADVESFIDACIEAQALELAYGVLEDQYERIPREIRRRLLLEAGPEEWKVFSRGRVGWVYSYPAWKTGTELLIPTFRLRGVASLVDFHDVVWRAVSDNTLSWADSVNMSNEMRDLLWMAVAKAAESIDDWTACLATQCPEGASSEDWLSWVAQRAFTDGARKQTTPGLEILVEAFKEVCPHARGLVPIALMSAGLDLEGGERHEPPDVEAIARLLGVLPSSDDGEIIPDWLSGTRAWTLGGYYHWDRDIGDLLAVFVAKMEELAQKGVLERDTTYERAMSFLEELRQRRQAL